MKANVFRADPFEDASTDSDDSSSEETPAESIVRGLLNERYTRANVSIAEEVLSRSKTDMYLSSKLDTLVLEIISQGYKKTSDFKSQKEEV
jgi:hypothetical protein